MHIQAALPFQIDFQEIRPGGCKNPYDAAPVARIRHFFGEHRINTSGQTTIAILTAALAGCLIGFIDEHDHLSQGMQHRKNFLEIRFCHANPAVAEILKNNARNAQFTGPAFNDERLAGSDAAGDEVTHRKRIHLSTPEEFRVLAEPRFHRIVARNLIQGERRFEELQQVLTLPLDQLLLHSQEPCRSDRSIVRKSCRQDFLRADAAQAGQAASQHFGGYFAFRRKLRKFRSDQRLQIVEHLGFAGQRNLQRGDVRVFSDQRIQIVHSFGKKHCDDVGLEDRRIVRPAQNLDDVRAEGAAELNGITAGNNEFGKIDDHRNLAWRFLPAADCLKVQRAKKVPVDELESSPGFACLQCGNLIPQYLLEPLAPILGPFGQAYSPAAIVLQHDVVAFEHHFLEECLERQQPPAPGILDTDNIENVSVNEKLGDGSGSKKVAHFFGPAGQLIDHCDSFWL